MTAARLIALASLALASCLPTPEPEAPRAASSDCVVVCTRYSEMECDEGQRRIDGRTCIEACSDMRFFAGLDVYFKCVVASKNCEEARGC